MKYLANLYVAELQPNRDPLTLKVVVTVFAGMIALVVLLALGGGYYVASQQALAEELSSRNAAVQRQVKQVQEELQQALHDRQLINEIESLQQSIAQRRRLMHQMQLLTQAGQASFAEVLTDLARVDSDQVWLTRILLANYEMTLQGQTTVAHALPHWLANFSHYATLRNRHFGVFELRDEDTGSLHFVVGSTAHSTLLEEHAADEAGVAPIQVLPQVVPNAGEVRP